jgi:hypothetical protein
MNNRQPGFASQFNQYTYVFQSSLDISLLKSYVRSFPQIPCILSYMSYATAHLNILYHLLNLSENQKCGIDLSVLP